MASPAILQKLLNPEVSKNFFYLIEIGLGILLIVLVRYFLPKSPESQFRVREADLPPSSQKLKRDSKLLAEARINQSNQNSAKLLPGIRLDQPANEILGVSIHATPSEVQKAYRNLMKQYHPDQVGRPGTREWQDAQKIAEAINRAKEEMLLRISKNKKD